MEILLTNLKRSVKNDYSLSFYKNLYPYRLKNGHWRIQREPTRVFFLPYVHTPQKALEWVNSKALHGKGIDWDFVRVYERRSRRYLGYAFNPNKPHP